MYKILMVIFIILLTPSLVHARPDDESIEEWAETRRQLAAEKSEPVLSVVVPVATVEPPVVETVEEDPDEFFCEASQINNRFFWVPVWCLARAIPQLPKEQGEVFYCKLGWYTGEDEYAVVPKPPGDELIIGWDICADLY